MFLMRGSKSTSVVSGPKMINLVFGVGIEINFGFVCGPKNTWFQFVARNELGFRAWIVRGLVSVCGAK